MARRMRIHRRVEVDTWQSPDFLALSAPKPNAQTLWLWLLTCERTIIVPGVIVARPAVMADDLRWPLRAFERCLAEIEAAGMVEVDREVGLVVLSKALLVDDTMRDGAGPAGENAAKSWATALQKIKTCQLRDSLMARVAVVISQCGEKISNAFAEAMVMPSARQPDAIDDAKRTQGTGNREQGKKESVPGPATPAALPLFGGQPQTETKTPPRDRAHELAEACCNAINAAIGSRYQPDAEGTRKLALALAKAGRTVDEMERVVADRVDEWRDDPRMASYLRPATILAAANFVKYLDDIDSRPPVQRRWVVENQVY
jgi:uncharacterized phage protein (TIGR02220 family)